jgi:hypothetical protein
MLLVAANQVVGLDLDIHSQPGPSRGESSLQHRELES